MSLLHPGCDTRHIIEKAMKSKSLATLAREYEVYNKLKNCQETQTEPPKEKISLYTKEDLINFKEKIKGKSSDEILDILGIEVTYNENGSKTLSEYRWPFKSYSFSVAGINEKELLDGVSEIKGNCDLIGSKLKNLGSVRKIGGSIRIPLFTDLEDLSNIKSIGGDIVSDVEDPQDAVDLIKKLNLNPSKIGGYIKTGSIECAFNYMINGFRPQSKNLEETLQALQYIQSKSNY